MYIDLNIVYVILSILACVALGYLIIAIRNVNKFVQNANELMVENKNSINDSMKQMPKVIKNCGEISDNLKDVTEVVTDVTADFIVKKESVQSNFQMITDIFNIIKSILGK